MVCSLFDCPFAILCHILKTSSKPMNFCFKHFPIITENNINRTGPFFTYTACFFTKYPIKRHYFFLSQHISCYSARFPLLLHVGVYAQFLRQVHGQQGWGRDHGILSQAGRHAWGKAGGLRLLRGPYHAHDRKE